MADELLRLLNERRARLRREREAIGPIDGAAILKCSSRDQWAMVLPDVSGGSAWRVQRFDRSGFVGHSVFADQELAIKAALDEGYSVRDDGALDEVSAAPRWERGCFLLDLVRSVNLKEMTHAQADERLREYDAKVAAEAAQAAQTAEGAQAQAGSTAEEAALQEGRGYPMARDA